MFTRMSNLLCDVVFDVTVYSVVKARKAILWLERRR